jgi:hypothetical protein
MKQRAEAVGDRTVPTERVALRPGLSAIVRRTEEEGTA